MVLVDFWTYSCINCQRTLPYLTAWDARYRDLGLTIVGVHSPEFAFEHDIGNVTDQAAALGVRYPVAIDNDFRTWREYDQRYWPAHYLIDRTGRVRQVHYGEGAYAETEAPDTPAPRPRAPAARRITRPSLMPEPAVPSDMPQAAPAIRAHTRDLPRLRPGGGLREHRPRPGQSHTYQAPAMVEPDLVALEGSWRLESERITAGQQARLLLHYRAAKVFLVLGGTGTVQAPLQASPPRTVQVSGAPTLYQIVDGPPRKGCPGPGGHPRGFRVRLHLRLAVGLGLEAGTNPVEQGMTNAGRGSHGAPRHRTETHWEPRHVTVDPKVHDRDGRRAVGRRRPHRLQQRHSVNHPQLHAFGFDDVGEPSEDSMMSDEPVRRLDDEREVVRRSMMSETP